MPPKNTAKKVPAARRGKPASSKPRPGASPPGPPRGKRTSVNVFDADLELLEPLRVSLRAATGLRVLRDSTLVQVACRVFSTGPAAVAALREVLALDGRH